MKQIPDHNTEVTTLEEHTLPEPASPYLVQMIDIWSREKCALSRPYHYLSSSSARCRGAAFHKADYHYQSTRHGGGSALMSHLISTRSSSHEFLGLVGVIGQRHADNLPIL